MVYLALSCLPQISCHTPLIAPKAPLLSQPISPLLGGSLYMSESLLFFTSFTPHQGQRPSPTSSSLPFSYFFPPTWLYGDLSCTLGVQDPLLVFSSVRNCYTCRCVLDTFVERDKLHVFLVLYHLDFSPINVI